MFVSNLPNVYQIAKLIPAAFSFTPVESPARCQVSYKESKKTTTTILPGVFSGGPEELLLSREHRAAVETVQALSYLKTLLFIDRYLVFPAWHSNNRPQHKGSRLARHIKTVEREVGRHDYVASECFYRYFIRNKCDWSRYSLTVLFDLSVIRQYRQLIHYNNAISPRVVHAIKEIYEKRLTFTELNAQVWCDEGSALEGHGRHMAKRDLIDMLTMLSEFLRVQAQRNVENVITIADRSLGHVKKLALENYFYEEYVKLFVSDGFCIPRFNWQLRSTLSEPLFSEVAAAID